MSETPPEPGDASGEGAAPEIGEDSILGSLPRSRPGVRSPRRDATAKARARKASQPKEAAAGSGGGPAQPADSANLEDLARAGATTAVQVAAAGLRFAGRAAGAIRESLERR
jgi:hypothetical protein